MYSTETAPPYMYKHHYRILDTHSMCSLQLTHGLVLAADGGWVVEDEDVPLKLPAGLRVQCRGNQDHSFPNLVPLVLCTHKEQRGTFIYVGVMVKSIASAIPSKCTYSSLSPFSLPIPSSPLPSCQLFPPRPSPSSLQETYLLQRKRCSLSTTHLRHRESLAVNAPNGYGLKLAIPHWTKEEGVS